MKQPWGVFEKLITSLLSLVTVFLVGAGGWSFRTMQSHNERIMRLEASRETDKLLIMRDVNERVDRKLDDMLKQVTAINSKCDSMMTELRVHMAKSGTASYRTNIYHVGGTNSHEYTINDNAN